MALAALLLLSSVQAVASVYKCKINGSVQYQQDPCPSNEARKPPTLEMLNAERQKQLVHKIWYAENSSNSSETSAIVGKKFRGNRSTPLNLSFRCDGRKACSQVTSCAEATYFLANCPGVMMDKDHNGIPCEKQWCSR